MPRRPAENFEQQTAGSGGSDRMRAVSIADSAHTARDAFRVYMLRLSTLIAQGPETILPRLEAEWAHSRWPPSRRCHAHLRRNGRAGPGLRRRLARERLPESAKKSGKSLRWNQPVTHETLFDAANQYAAKQLELHAHYAQWTGLEALGASVADLQQTTRSGAQQRSCLLAIGWGAGFLSKSAAIGTDEADHRKVLGMLPFYERAIKSGLPFPKTRRVVFLKNKPATLPGWVELKVG